MAKGKMTLKKYEGSVADTAAEKSGRAAKEGSKKEIAADKMAMAKMNKRGSKGR